MILVKRRRTWVPYPNGMIKRLKKVKMVVMMTAKGKYKI